VTNEAKGSRYTLLGSDREISAGPSKFKPAFVTWKKTPTLRSRVRKTRRGERRHLKKKKQEAKGENDEPDKGGGEGGQNVTTIGLEKSLRIATTNQRANHNNHRE